MSAPEMSHDEAIGQFCGVTGADEERARSLLEACEWNLELAINMHLQSDNDGVRAPIVPVRQILNPNPIGYPASEMPHAARRYNTRTGPISEVYDAFRDFQAEAQWQEMVQDGETTSANAGSDNSRRQTLQELYRPPLELMFRGPFTTARENGTSQNRWLLVNVHDGREFACQILNRDVWSNQTVKDIIKEHFIFWQVYHDSYEGQRYVQFYHVKSLPHVAIIDPRTGELMKSWPTSIDHNSFCDSVIEFLTEHPSPDGSSDANTMKKLRVKEEGVDDQDDEPEIIPARATLYDQSEEAQLEAAIRASLRETEKVNRNDETIEIDEDTIEAIDIMEPQQIARDKKLAERESSVSDNNSKPKNNDSFQPKSQIQPQPTSFASSGSSYNQPPKANNNSVTPKDEPVTTAAEALKAIADKKQVDIEGPECRIALRFPDGSSLVQKFSASEQLESVKDFVQMGRSTFRSSKIEFVAPPNRKLTESMMSETLESLGLCPASRLEVKCVQE